MVSVTENVIPTPSKAHGLTQIEKGIDAAEDLLTAEERAAMVAILAAADARLAEAMA